MTSPRRAVRPLPDFFDSLDAQLEDERGPHGEPSRYDFLSLELPKIMKLVAARWDTLPELIPGRPEYRVMIERGRLVAAYSVDAQLAPDGTIQLIRVRLELEWPSEPDDETPD